MFKTYSLCFHQISFLLQEAASLVAQTIKRLPAVQETRVRSLGWEDPLEKEMATHSSMLAWRIPWTEEPGGLPSMGSRRVGHDWATSLSFLSFYKNRGLLGGSVVKNPPATQETQVPSRGWEEPLEEEMATLSRLLAWETPWTEEPGGLQSMGSQRVGHNWSHWTEQQHKNRPFSPGPSSDGQRAENLQRGWKTPADCPNALCPVWDPLYQRRRREPRRLSERLPWALRSTDTH